MRCIASRWVYIILSQLFIPFPLRNLFFLNTPTVYYGVFACSWSTFEPELGRQRTAAVRWYSSRTESSLSLMDVRTAPRCRAWVRPAWIAGEVKSLGDREERGRASPRCGQGNSFGWFVSMEADCFQRGWGSRGERRRPHMAATLTFFTGKNRDNHQVCIMSVNGLTAQLGELSFYSTTKAARYFKNKT